MSGSPIGRRLALAAWWLAGCSPAGRGVPANLGAAGQAGVTHEGGVTGRLIFDVTATLTARADVDVGAAPGSIRFPLILDADRNEVMGGNSAPGVVAVATDDGRTFRVTWPLSIAANADPCGGAFVTFQDLEVTVAGGTLRGISKGVAGGWVPFTAELVGVPDTTTPILKVQPGAPALEPIASFRLLASEPLLPGATARLLASDGTAVDLVPQLEVVPFGTGAVARVIAFAKPEVVLRPGAGYSVLFDGLVDLSGNRAPTGSSLRLGSVAALQALPQDGFESAKQGSLMGADLIGPDDKLPLITGQRSAYVPGPGSLSRPARLLGRLAVPAGARRLHLAYRLVSPQLHPAGGGVRIGAPGGAATFRAFQAAPTEESRSWPDGSSVIVGGAQELDAPLPDDVRDEVVVSIEPSQTAACEPIDAPLAGVIVDDLRVDSPVER